MSAPALRSAEQALGLRFSAAVLAPLDHERVQLKLPTAHSRGIREQSEDPDLELDGGVAHVSLSPSRHVYQRAFDKFDALSMFDE